MRNISSHGAKDEFGLIIDPTRASPVMIDKHGSSAVVVVTMEEYERLSGKPMVR